jgi:hypothetical protein
MTMETLLDTLIIARRTLADVQRFLRKHPSATTPPELFAPSLLNRVSYLRTTLGRLQAFEKRRLTRRIIGSGRKGRRESLAIRTMGR